MYESKLFDDIKTVLPKLTELQQKGSITISIDEKILVGDIFKIINPTAQVSLGCDACISFYLNHILSFYEREFPKFQAKQSMELPIAAQEQPKPNRKTKNSNGSKE